MSEEKKQIIHKVFLDQTSDEFRYWCNRACNTTNNKSSLTWYKVTCKNCLRGRK